MSTFPAIEPSTRTFDFGEIAMSVSATSGGLSTRFSHAEDPLGHLLTLGFNLIYETDVMAIRAHALEQSVGHVSFALPEIVWRGHPDVETIVPEAGRWKYVKSPEETHVKGKLYNVAVLLEYVGDTIYS